MHFDFAHAAAVTAILFAALRLLKGRPVPLQLGVIFVAVFVLNIFWPY